MITNIILGALIFSYAGWTLVRYINKSKQGRCVACSLNKSCSTDCNLDDSEVKNQSILQPHAHR